MRDRTDSPAFYEERIRLLVQEVENLEDRNRWRWPHERDRRLAAEAENQRLREALEAIIALYDRPETGRRKTAAMVARAALDGTP